MTDNFEDETFDDLVDDRSLLELANWNQNLLLPSPSSFRQQAARIHPLSQRPEPVVPSLGTRRGPEVSPWLFNSGNSAGCPAPGLGAVGGGLVPGPTRPGAFSGPPPATPRRTEPSPIDAWLRLSSATDPILSPSQLNSPSLRTYPRTPTPEAFSWALDVQPPSHSLPQPQNLPTTSISLDFFHTDRHPRPIQPHPRAPRHALNTNPITGTPVRPTFEITNFGHDTGNNSSESPSDVLPLSAMSTNTRSKRTVRAGDLTMPSAPSQPGQPSRATRSGSRPSPSSNKRKRGAGKDDLFGSDVFGDEQIIDLVDKDDVPEDILTSQKEDDKKYTRLSKHDCAICMDSMSNLTVTHCGHLFCSECLHSALNIDPSRRICPICRQKIDNLPQSGKFTSKNKGFYPLELKLMTRQTLGRSTNTPQASQSAQGGRES